MYMQRVYIRGVHAEDLRRLGSFCCFVSVGWVANKDLVELELQIYLNVRT